MFGFLLPALSSVLLQPIRHPGAYKKHWGNIGVGAAGIATQVYGEQLGLTPVQIQGFITVCVAVVVNLMGNSDA